MDKQLRIAVIGAGMGGLTATLALQRLGFSPVLYEQATALTEIGAGLTMSPNAVRVMNHLGLEADLKAIGFTPDLQLVRHYRTGEILLEIPRGDRTLKRYGAGYYYVHRADLHALLARSVASHDARAIVLGAKLTGVEASEHGATARFADGRTVACDVLIGADGVRSVVRDSLFPKAAASFTGHVAWRGLVPSETLPRSVLDSPPGIHIGPGQLFMRYPLRGGSIMNYAAFSRDAAWQDESWSARSSVADAVQAFAGWDSRALDIVKATPSAGCFKWALFTRAPLSTWRAGRVTLLGDAAHGMLPFMGQGAAMSIEDGMVLARALAAHEDPSEALKRYEAVRREYTTWVQSKSRGLGEYLQGTNPERFATEPFENEEALGLFGYDATTVPIDPV